MSKVKGDVTIGLIYNAIAKTYFEYSKMELQHEAKDFANRAINRLSINEQEALSLLSDEDREVFKTEIYKTDLLQYSHILMQLLAMGSEQRDLAESMIDAIFKKEANAYKEPVY
jgi:hypothetical protein